MAILILDPDLEDRVRARRGEVDRDEVWDGVLVMLPMANLEHQDIAGMFYVAISHALGSRQVGRVFQGCIVSDRDRDWRDNYRIPDVALYLTGNPAKDCDTHWFGGPDLAVEIVSDQDGSRDKAAFYAKIGVREFLVIDRDPWAVELYRRVGDSLALDSRSTVDDGTSIRLGVLPLAIGLIKAGDGRPSIVVDHESDGRPREI